MKLIVCKAGMVLLLVLPLSAGQRQPYTLSVDVDLVVLNVRVLDKAGKPVPDLLKEHFRIEEDGRRQDTVLFAEEHNPATIGLVVDVSGSLGSKRSEVEAAAARFVETGYPTGQPKNQMFVLKFNETLYWPLPENVPFTDDVELLKQALAWRPPGGRTALYDAVEAALLHVEQGRWDKRVLIVLSDGGDNASARTLDDIVRLAQQSNVTIHTVGLFNPFTADSNPRVLRKLAELTGGEFYQPQTVEELIPVWDQIANGIRTQYTLGYRPAQTSLDGRYHKTRVRVDAPGLRRVTVRTRPGYLARKADALLR